MGLPCRRALQHSTCTSAFLLLQAGPLTCACACCAVAQACKRLQHAGGETRDLWLVLAELYQQQGRLDEALVILLEQQVGRLAGPAELAGLAAAAAAAHPGTAAAATTAYTPTSATRPAGAPRIRLH
jgi:hypothetical protein